MLALRNLDECEILTVDMHEDRFMGPKGPVKSRNYDERDPPQHNPAKPVQRPESSYHAPNMSTRTDIETGDLVQLFKEENSEVTAIEKENPLLV